MALNAKHALRIVDSVFVLRDWTRPYEALNNPGGYGAPNPAFGDITPYTAVWTPPLSTTPAYTLDLYASPPAPNVDGDYRYLVPAASLSPDGMIKSGVWKVLITLGNAQWERFHLATGDIKSRITKCVCGDPKGKIQLDLDLMSAQRSFRCYDNVRAQQIITDLYRRTAECCGCGH